MGMTTKWYRVSLGSDDEHILQLTVVMVTQLCEYILKTTVVHFEMGELYGI